MGWNQIIRGRRRSTSKRPGGPTAGEFVATENSKPKAPSDVLLAAESYHWCLPTAENMIHLATTTQIVPAARWGLSQTTLSTTPRVQNGLGVTRPNLIVRSQTKAPTHRSARNMPLRKPVLGQTPGLDLDLRPPSSETFIGCRRRLSPIHSTSLAAERLSPPPPHRTAARG